MVKPLNLCGQKIAKIRSANVPSLTQERLTAQLQANGLDIDRASLAKIETGKRKVYDYELLAFSQVLNVSINELLRDDK